MAPASPSTGAPQTRQGVALKAGALLVREWKGRLNDQSEALTLADRIAILKDGELTGNRVSPATARPWAALRRWHHRPQPDGPTCLVLDVRLPGQSGLDLQRELAAANRELPIIFITGHGDIKMSVQAMKGGAIEFLTRREKPLK
jgi:DNA-binding NtrC family response regulator